MNRQTYLAKNQEVEQAWWTVDAGEHRLGRLSTRIAMVLMGKHKPQYTPHVDTGDFVVVTNAGQIQLTGDKADQKVYQTFTGYAGGRKTYSYRWMLQNRPEKLIEQSVRRMMPKNKLADRMMKKLKVYRGTDHPHQAQQPQPLSFDL